MSHEDDSPEREPSELAKEGWKKVGRFWVWALAHLPLIAGAAAYALGFIDLAIILLMVGGVALGFALGWISAIRWFDDRLPAGLKPHNHD